MNKSEFIKEIAEVSGLTVKDSTTFVNAYATVVGKTLRKAKKTGDTICITDFGTFKVSKREAREGINPRNPKEKIEIPETYVIGFTAGKKLKDTVKGEPEKKVAAKKTKKTAAPVKKTVKKKIKR